MTRIKIESRDLLNMGISDKAYAFYSNTDPIDIYQTECGFEVIGCIEFSCSSANDLLSTLEDMANEFGEE